MAKKASPGMTGDQIEKVFSALSRIETKLDGHVEALATHISHDDTVNKALFERIEVLQVGMAKQKGFVAAMGAVGGGVIAALGYIADKVLGFGHH
jgi:hypothetical protein